MSHADITGALQPKPQAKLSGGLAEIRLLGKASDLDALGRNFCKPRLQDFSRRERRLAQRGQKFFTSLHMQGVGIALALNHRESGQALDEWWQTCKELLDSHIRLHRHEATLQCVDCKKPRFDTSRRALMQGFTRARDIIARVGRRWWEMLMQQNARNQTQHRRLIRDRSILKAIGDPCLTGDIVEPPARTSRAHKCQLRKQIVTRSKPTNPLIRLFAVIDARRAEAALDRRRHTIAQFLRCDAMNNRI